jgi:hypothetical protein
MKLLQGVARQRFHTASVNSSRSGRLGEGRICTLKQTLEVYIELRKLTHMGPECAHSRANPKLDAIKRPPHKVQPEVSPGRDCLGV